MKILLTKKFISMIFGIIFLSQICNAQTNKLLDFDFTPVQITDNNFFSYQLLNPQIKLSKQQLDELHYIFLWKNDWTRYDNNLDVSGTTYAPENPKYQQALNNIGIFSFIPAALIYTTMLSILLFKYILGFCGGRSSKIDKMSSNTRIFWLVVLGFFSLFWFTANVTAFVGTTKVVQKQLMLFYNLILILVNRFLLFCKIITSLNKHLNQLENKDIVYNKLFANKEEAVKQMQYIENGGKNINSLGLYIPFSSNSSTTEGKKDINTYQKFQVFKYNLDAIIISTQRNNNAAMNLADDLDSNVTSLNNSITAIYVITQICVLLSVFVIKKRMAAFALVIGIIYLILSGCAFIYSGLWFQFYFSLADICEQGEQIAIKQYPQPGTGLFTLFDCGDKDSSINIGTTNYYNLEFFKNASSFYLDYVVYQNKTETMPQLDSFKSQKDIYSLTKQNPSNQDFAQWNSVIFTLDSQINVLQNIKECVGLRATSSYFVEYICYQGLPSVYVAFIGITIMAVSLTLMGIALIKLNSALIYLKDEEDNQINIRLAGAYQ